MNYKLQVIRRPTVSNEKGYHERKKMATVLDT